MKTPLTAVMLTRYAQVLINFALNSGQGLKQGEVVYCAVPDVAKPLYGALQAAILQAGGHPMMRLVATGFTRQFYELANEAQLTFFPGAYLKGRVKLIDHYVGIIAETDPFELEGISPEKIVTALEARKQLREWQNDKEYAGKFTWTIALWGTPAMAKIARLSLDEYWQQIVRACYLDMDEPISKWQEVQKEQRRVLNILNQMPIDQLHLVSRETDLWLTLGEKRVWVGGSGRNIPSFELFTSPDWRGTRGQISFDQPLYRYGNRVEGISLSFRQGKIVTARAKKGQAFLRTMLKRPNADKLGEFSLTDARLSRINRFMATTLYDENIGGEFGNTHVAVGMAYKDAYDGDPRELNKTLAKKFGFNDSGEHTDMISTQERTVTAIMKDGSERVIYTDGHFVV